jgi:hypothetical protein
MQAAVYALDLAKLAQRQANQVNDQADEIRELRLRVRTLEKANEWLRRQVDRLRDPSHRAAIVERLKHSRRDVELWEAEPRDSRRRSLIRTKPYYAMPQGWRVLSAVRRA